MYCQSKIQEKLHAARLHLGWQPEYHSVEECDFMVKRLNAAIEIDGSRNITFIRELTQKEINWIRNERAVCFADAMYFKLRYAWLSDETNNLIRYRPRRSQLIFHNVIADLEEKGHSIEIQALKGRQVGMSTEVELDFTHRLIFVPGCQAITASADSQKSELMVRMFYTAIENLPWWMVPQIRKNRRSGGRGLLEFHTGSIIAVQSGAQETGIGQGWTPTNIHISEACDYQNAKKTLEEGLLRACHSTPSLFLVFESTGNGNTGWWPETWRSSKEFYWQGRARLLPLFIPWYAATDLYPEPSWLEKFPIPVDWRPSSECRKHAAKAKAFVRSTPYLQKEFGLGWEMPVEQMWFWDFNYQEAVRKRAGKSWVRQMPGDDHEALQGSHDSVFDPETINVVTKDRRTDYQVYGIVGEGIDERHEPHVSEVDYTDAAPPRIEIEWNSPRGMRFQWMLVPLKPVEESDEKTAMTKLIVYEPPIPGCDYGIGADTAEGHGEEGDRTVFCVTRKGAIGEPDIQAAEFCSDVVSTADSAAFIACLAAWYGKGISGWGMPVIAIEQRRKPGDDAQNQLIKMGFHRHYKFHRLDGKNSEREEQRANRLGWYTTEWSRAYLHGRFIEAIDNRWFEANSIFLIRECDGLEHSRGGKKSTIDHKEGKHDDRVFAAGISIVILHTREVHLERAQKRYSAPKDMLPKIDMRTPTELQFSVGNF